MAERLPPRIHRSLGHDLNPVLRKRLQGWPRNQGLQSLLRCRRTSRVERIDLQCRIQTQ
jgi:hypothetical protein